MRLFGTIVLLCALCTGPADAVCLVTPLSDDLASADTVFVATITRVTMSKPPAEMRDKERYVVQYDFDVVKVFKGDASIVTWLVTGARFNDPTDDVSWKQAEQSRYVPGDSILVVSGSGEAPVSSIGCTPSRPWDSEAQHAAAKYFSATPN